MLLGGWSEEGEALDGVARVAGPGAEERARVTRSPVPAGVDGDERSLGHGAVPALPRTSAASRTGPEPSRGGAARTATSQPAGARAERVEHRCDLTPGDGMLRPDDEQQAGRRRESQSTATTSSAPGGRPPTAKGTIDAERPARANGAAPSIALVKSSATIPTLTTAPARSGFRRGRTPGRRTC